MAPTGEGDDGDGEGADEGFQCAGLRLRPGSELHTLQHTLHTLTTADILVPNHGVEIDSLDIADRCALGAVAAGVHYGEEATLSPPTAARELARGGGAAVGAALCAATVCQLQEATPGVARIPPELSLSIGSGSYGQVTQVTEAPATIAKRAGTIAAADGMFDSLAGYSSPAENDGNEGNTLSPSFPPLVSALASREEVGRYLEKHDLQEFLAHIVNVITRVLPLDPYAFMIAHIKDLVEEFRAMEARKELKHQQLVLPEEREVRRELSSEEQDRVVKHLVLALQHPDLMRASALKFFRTFSKDGKRLAKHEFADYVKHLESAWGLNPDDGQLMVDVLKRWRFRANAAHGTQGLPLWPLELEDFVKSYPNLLRAVRDRYTPIGGMVHRGLFIRQATGSLQALYDIGSRIGRGAYGEVFLVTRKSTGERRVCKRVRQQQQRVPSEELVDEVDLLRNLDHPHIIRIFEYFQSGTYIEMIMEPVFGGTLAQLVQGLHRDANGQPLNNRPDCLTESWVATLCSQLLGALTYAHDVVGIVHKDLKCENVLLVGKPGLSAEQVVSVPVHAMLTDFGIAEVFNPDPLLAGPEGRSSVDLKMQQRAGGTPPYMSPEMFGGSFTEKCDIWSLGVCTFRLMTGTLPYRSTNLLMQAYVVSDPRTHPHWELLAAYRWSLGARFFCQQLLAKDERIRPSAAEASRDDWLLKEQMRDTGDVPSAAERASLQCHHMQSHLMRMARHCITSQLSLTPLSHLNQRFRHYDRDGNGRLSLLEMRQVLEDVGISRTEDVDLIVESLDSNRNGFIEYTEFIAGCLDFASDSMRAHIRAVFDIFDLDGSGDISVDEMRQVLTQGANPEDSKMLRSPMQSECTYRRTCSTSVLPDGKTVEEVMQELDTNGTGRVEYEEFERYLLNEFAGLGRRLETTSEA